MLCSTPRCHSRLKAIQPAYSLRHNHFGRPKNQSFRNNSGKLQPIQISSVHMHSRQRSGNFGCARAGAGKIAEHGRVQRSHGFSARQRSWHFFQLPNRQFSPNCAITKGFSKNFPFQVICPQNLEIGGCQTITWCSLYICPLYQCKYCITVDNNGWPDVSKSIYIRRLVTRRRSLVLHKQIRLQLSSELTETVRWPQWSRQLVPKSLIRRHQTTCRPDEFWTTVWRMWWHQMSGDGDWPQAPTCTRLRDTTARQFEVHTASNGQPSSSSSHPVLVFKVLWFSRTPG